MLKDIRKSRQAAVSSRQKIQSRLHTANCQLQDFYLLTREEFIAPVDLKKIKTMKLTKKRKAVQGKVDAAKLYSLNEASKLVKETTTCKFDASVDLHIQLGVDPKKADQQVRGTVSLPHGTGKTKKVLVLCTPDKEAAAKEAGADHYLVKGEYMPTELMQFMQTHYPSFKTP